MLHPSSQLLIDCQKSKRTLASSTEWRSTQATGERTTARRALEHVRQLQGADNHVQKVLDLRRLVWARSRMITQSTELLCRSDGLRSQHPQPVAKSGWNSGGRRVDPEGLVGMKCREEVLLSTRGVVWEEGYALSPEKIWFFHLKWHVLVSDTFCPCSCQKNVEFSAWSGDFVDIEDVLLGNSEYSVRIMGLISFLLHYCIVMQAIF